MIDNLSSFNAVVFLVSISFNLAILYFSFILEAATEEIIFCSVASSSVLFI
ncbi:hypothetical protein HOG21_03780 [bacterium]|nr:hypothetical protein [bacterium]